MYLNTTMTRRYNGPPSTTLLGLDNKAVKQRNGTADVG